ncbi:hypothetical protein BH10PSE12_BH10PSE12_35770 [soil metagenome]
MRIGHMAMGTLAGLALIAASVTPAQARGRGWGNGYGGGWGGYGHRHHDDFDFGDAVGIAALIGAAAIVVGSMNKDRKVQTAGGSASRDVPEPQGDGYTRDSDYTGTGSDNNRSYGSASTSDNANDAPAGDVASESAAVDACAVAARDEASADGGYAEIRDIGAPKSVSGGWDVDGRVERRAAYRDQAGSVRRFTCSIRDGRVSEVYVSKDVAA